MKNKNCIRENFTNRTNARNFYEEKSSEGLNPSFFWLNTMGRGCVEFDAPSMDEDEILARCGGGEAVRA